MKLNQKIKLGIIFGVMFLTIVVILILVFVAGKKSYTVVFDLNGGTLISGDLEQVVTQGKSATPPKVAKDGCYLHSWSGSYKQVTRNVVIVAEWEWETSVGFDYTSSEDSNYCEITGCFKDLTGDVYVGVYHNNKKVLGIRGEAFKDCVGIEKVHMLDGILSMGNNVFEGCEKLVTVELPGTLTKLGSYAFKNCTSLESIELPDGITVIEEGTFEGCTSLKEIVLPDSLVIIKDGAFAGCESLEKITFGDTVVSIGAAAFSGCTSLTEVIIPEGIIEIGELAFDGAELVIKTPIAEVDRPEGWAENCFGEATVEWGIEVIIPDEDPDEEDGEDEDHENEKDKNGKKNNWLK